MKTINALVLFITIVVISGCTTSKDGNYVVTDISLDDKNLTTLTSCNGDTINGRSIASMLRNKLQGKKYQLKIKSDFALVRDMKENEEMVLAYKSDNDGGYYATEIIKGNGMEIFNIQLRLDVGGKIALIVDLTAKQQLTYIPTQLGGRLNWDNCGRAICYLGKLD